MKKLILGLFLILGALSFAAPKYVNTDKITQLGYKVDNDIPEIFLFQKYKLFDKKGAAAFLQLLLFHFSCSDIFRQNADKICLVLPANRTCAIRFRHLLMNIWKTLCLILFRP